MTDEDEEIRFQLNETAKMIRDSRVESLLPQEEQGGKFTYPEGSVIFEEGQLGAALYVVLEGEVQIIKRLENGSSRILAVMGPHDFFGEMSLIDKKTRSATAYCRTEVKVLRIPSASLSKFIETNPKFVIKMLNMFVRRLRNANKIIESAMVRDPYHVIIDGLKEYARTEGIRSLHGTRLKTEEFVSWANYRLGVPEQTIQQVLQELIKAGKVKKGALETEIVLRPFR